MNPLDERMHPVGDHPAWSESYYFNFVDPDSHIGMFTRMGFRPREGWADGLHVVFLGGDRVAFTYGRRDIQPDLTSYDHDLRVADLELVCVVPFQNWEVGYDGPCQDVPQADVLLERRKERPEGWYRPGRLKMRLDFNATSQPHYAENGQRGHFEQIGRVRGAITLLGDGHTETFNVGGFGVRDKSWGPRDWGGAGAGTGSQPGWYPGAAPAPFVNWFSMNFGDDLALGGACFRQADGTLKGSGWMFRNGRTVTLEDAEMHTEYRGDSLAHAGVHLKARAEDTPVEVTGRVLTVCPTKIATPGGATFVNEGLTEFQFDGRTGYGISEHWHRVVVKRRKQP